MCDDDIDDQIIFGDLGALKLPEICLTSEENPENLTQEICTDRGSNPGPLLDRRACYRLSHSGGRAIFESQLQTSNIIVQPQILCNNIVRLRGRLRKKERRKERTKDVCNRTTFPLFYNVAKFMSMAYNWRRLWYRKSVVVVNKKWTKLFIKELKIRTLFYGVNSRAGAYACKTAWLRVRPWFHVYMSCSLH